MAENIEIKARASRFDHQKRLAARIAGGPAEILHQRDVFFQVPRGRLKLRHLSPDLGNLIAYERADVTGPKSSRYELTVTNEPARLERVLQVSLPVVGVVVKKRTLYLAGQTRIHLDEVEGLGEFLELEVVLTPEQDPAEGRAIAERLMDALEIESGDLIAVAYFDLLPEHGAT